MLLNAVESKRGLVHGRLHAHGESCAVGSFFDVNKDVPLPFSVIDEIAAVNDSMPHLSEAKRKIRVAQWLRWKLASLGMPGFSAPKVAARKSVATNKR
jgi:hypothetical protein